MKILLINTGQYMPLAGFNYPLNTFQPVGIGYIANVLLREGYKVAILDALAEGFDREEIRGKFRYVGLPDQQIKKRIRAFSPDIVGISVPFTNQARAGHEMARIVKNISKNIKVVVGGSYPTNYPQLVLKDKNIDFVVMGEGEVVFRDLVKRIEKRVKTFNDAKGLAFRQKNSVKINERGPLLMDLDNYQIAWELLPMDKYFEAAYKVKSSRSISTYGKRWATIFTSRGCPYLCTFCVGHEVMGRVWRQHSVDNVMAEMEYLIKQYKIEHFDIEDDNFTLDKKRAKEICDRIVKKGWDIEWSTPNGIRADTADEELIKKMKKAGCVRTIVAPESGDQWVVDTLMRKKINLEKVKQVVSWCKKYHLAVDGFFLIGMPGEKEENVVKTIEYAKELRRLGLDECIFGIVVPHKGTEIYETVVKNDWLKLPSRKSDIVESLAIEEAIIETPFLSIKRAKELQKLANKVNSLIPFSRIKLITTIAVKTPRRFLRLLISDFEKRLGYAGGKLGV